jgi:nucleoside-diphosphate-sugar epimerase
MTRTVAITGSSGFLGGALTRALLARSDFTVAKVRRLGSAGERDRSPGESMAVVADATSGSAWIDAGLQHVDVLVHLAAHMGGATAPGEDVAANLDGNVLFGDRLLKALPGAPTRLIFASTVEVYRMPPDGVPLTEASPIGPSSFYGASKFFAENLMREYCRSRGTSLIIARLGHLYGPGEADGPKLVPTAIRAAVAGAAPQVIDDPQARRDLMYVADAVEALTRMVDLDCDHEEIINVASGRSSTVWEILSLIADLAGSPPPQVAARRDCVSHSVEQDVDYMRRRLGAWPMVTLAAGLQAEIKSYRRAG